MQTGAISSINFKGHYQEYDYDYDFANEGYSKAINTVNEAQDTFINSKDIKGPGALFVAIGCLLSKLGLKGAATALLIDQTTKNKASKAFDAYLKQGLNKAQVFGMQLTQSHSKGLIKKAKKTIGESIETTAKQFSENAVKNGATKNFGLLGAAATIIAFAPKAIFTDNNKDGVKDIAQYSQVYDDSSAQLDRLQEKASMVGKLIALIT